MKKLLFFAFILAAISMAEACNSGSNGDASRRGKSDTVGAAQKKSGISAGKDSTNGLKDTLKHN